jgi:hypothetical protein
MYNVDGNTLIEFNVSDNLGVKKEVYVDLEGKQEAVTFSKCY